MPKTYRVTFRVPTQKPDCEGDTAPQLFTYRFIVPDEVKKHSERNLFWSFGKQVFCTTERHKQICNCQVSRLAHCKLDMISVEFIVPDETPLVDLSQPTATIEAAANTEAIEREEELAAIQKRRRDEQIQRTRRMLEEIIEQGEEARLKLKTLEQFENDD
jgi:hypothetical protein